MRSAAGTRKETRQARGVGFRVSPEEPGMRPQPPSRRDFLRASAAATAALSFGSLAFGRTRVQAASASGLERRKFGKTDMTVAVLGFGGAEIGYEGAKPETVSTLLNAALDAGLHVVATAECYLESETLIGTAIGHRRKEYYLFTKCGHAPGSGGGGDWSKAGILKSIERSLKRLKTDAVDLVQLHSCSKEELEKGECIEALEDAKDQGLTRYIGYSGDSHTA